MINICVCYGLVTMYQEATEHCENNCMLWTDFLYCGFDIPHIQKFSR